MPGFDQSLLNGCINGDRTSQQKLFNQYAPKLLVICQRFAKNKEDAEEILQEGFYKAFKNIKQFKSSGPLEGWLRKIIVNTAIARYRSRANMHLVIPLSLNKHDIPDDVDIYASINYKDIIQIIQRLPTSSRMVFNLFVFEGYKHREIATMLGISEGTSKSNLFDARLSLQKSLMARMKLNMRNIR
ncbi:MAG TPA: sigma-70 family RNA polymerase sigma factor [Chitinophagaceae bacterium]